MDAACLAQVIIDAIQKQRDPGSFNVLRRYERWRKGDNQLVQMAMNGFHDLFGFQSPGLIYARSQGLNFINRFNVLKNWLMSFALPAVPRNGFSSSKPAARNPPSPGARKSLPACAKKSAAKPRVCL